MKLKDILELDNSQVIELHDGFDGKMIAKSKSSLWKYGEVEVLAIYPSVKVDKPLDIVQTISLFLFVYGDHNDIEKVKKYEDNRL